MTVKEKRFEFVMDNELYNSIAERARAEGISIASVVRSLLAQWDHGEITAVSIENRPIQRNEAGECKFYLSATCSDVYQFSVVAGCNKMTRIELIQLLMRAIIDDRINIDRLLCDCD